jgi:hypothetical protein
MAAKKTTGSSAPKKKAAAKKKAAKKKAAKKSAAKKPAAAPKKKKAAAKKTVQSDAPAKTEPKVEASKAPAEPTPDVPPEGAGMSMEVSLGHVFALRPRVNTSFRQNDLSEARRALKDEVYPDIATAARAVAEEALSLTRGAASQRPRKHRRR